MSAPIGVTVADGDDPTSDELEGLPPELRPHRVSLTKTLLQRVGLPLGLFIIVVTLWQALVFNHLFSIATYTVPQPSTILSTLHDDWSTLWDAQRLTLTEAIEGYLFGAAVGLLVAIVAVASGIGTRFLVSLAGLVNAIPIVAIAPIFVLYLGYDQSSKIAVVALLCAAIMCLNAVKGLTSVKDDPVQLMHSYSAPRWQVIVKLRLPSSLPFLFIALKYNVTIALVAAIISEFFGGYGGVGIEMQKALVTFAMPTAWAAIVLVGVTGVIWFELMIGLEYLCTRRHASARASALS